MKTLSNSCHKVICWGRRNKPSSSVTFRDDILFPLQNHTEQLLHLGVLHLASTQRKDILPVSKAQENWQAAEREDRAISETNTVHVKFQLQKECMYGEQFLLLGDDPLLGKWDPENALPLTWSDGHVWTVDLDLPVGKAIQFKFILIDEGGEISWQPGSDRIVKTWETEKTIAVFEDWDNAELQKLVEAEKFANQDKQEPEIEAQKLIVAENLTSQMEELPYDANKQSSIASKDVSELKQMVEPQVELLVADSSSPTDQLNTDITIVGDSMSMVADNIGLPVKNNRAAHSEKHTARLNDKSIDTKMSLGNNGSATAVKNTESFALGDLVYNEEVPVLVPGLLPLEDAEDEATPDEVDRRMITDNPVRALGIKDHNMPEFENMLVSDDGAPQGANEMLTNQEEAVKFSNQEESLENKAEKTGPKDATHKKLHSTSPQLNVLQNDIQWGHRTLQKFLTNLGLIQPSQNS